MTKPEAMQKLLALGALTMGDARKYTGWTPEECSAALDALIKAGAVTYSNIGIGQRVYHIKGQLCFS